MSRRERLKPEALNEPLARQKVNEFGNPSFSSDYSSAFDIGKEYAQQEHCWKSVFLILIQMRDTHWVGWR